LASPFGRLIESIPGDATMNQIQQEQSERTEMKCKKTLFPLLKLGHRTGLPARELGHHQHEKRLKTDFLFRFSVLFPGL